MNPVKEIVLQTMLGQVILDIIRTYYHIKKKKKQLYFIIMNVLIKKFLLWIRLNVDNYQLNKVRETNYTKKIYCLVRTFLTPYK